MIWGLADSVAPKGKLSVDEFFVALKLIALAQCKLAVDLASLSKSCALPVVGSVKPEAVLPEAAAKEGGAEAATVAAGDAPAFAKELSLPVEDVVAYQTLWSEPVKTASFVAAGNAVKFLQTSKLPVQQLRAIWTLSDTVAPKGKLRKFISLNNISYMLRYLYEKPPHNNRTCGHVV